MKSGIRFTVKHDIKGRIRIHLTRGRLSVRQADLFSFYLASLPQVTAAKVYERIGDAAITYTGSKEDLIAEILRFSFDDEELNEIVPVTSTRELNQEFQEKLVTKCLTRCLTKIFLPAPVRAVWTAIQSVPFVIKGIRKLAGRKLEVEVLDATAITVSMLRCDFNTAGSVMFLLGIGELLEDWTHKKSVSDLAGSMSLNIERVWQKTEDGEVLVPISDIKEGDLVSVRVGSVIPLDGIVDSGEAMVNQASMTGESEPVRKENGMYVYAGTAVEEGNLIVRVKKAAGSTRFERIVKMIEESEKLKSSLETKASGLADALVPWSLGGTIVTYLLTRNVTKAISILMVDFSCALKLAMPLSVLSAMREASSYKMTVKGGSFMEAVAEADTIVFDKTGTLTKAQPVVADVVTFEGRDQAEMLRIAACLEEHFPHSMANAVVRAARERNLAHEEMHSQVEYIVAHGISSMVENKKVVIGSAHFIFEDEKCTVPAGEQEKYDALPVEFSHLYLAIGGELAAVICIADPLRPEACDVMKALRALGIKRTVMLTGDSERTAAAIAAEVGVDDYRAEVLPEDKANFVEQERAAGHTVIMLGDGINDSPALSAANVGVAISDGAAIAREIADITIAAENLFELVALRRIAQGLMSRINSNYRFVIGFNGSLIGLGVAGVLAPATSAMMHNLSTLGISLRSMTNLIDSSETTRLLESR